MPSIPSPDILHILMTSLHFRKKQLILPVRARAWGVLILLVLLQAGCGPTVYFVKPPDWQGLRARDSTIAHFRPAIRGKTFCLDPGHGPGVENRQGPAGDVYEPEVNFRVALMLKRYLERAGANVVLTRTAKTNPPLEKRKAIARQARADFFISIHHNAAGNLFTNYTSTWYHGRPGTRGYHPANHDLARYIQRDLSYVMGNPGSLASFDGTMSDYLLYPEKGFAVLRDMSIPAVLVECAFFTSAYEEKRLSLEDFNAIEAWGIFRGIGRYLADGTPIIIPASGLEFATTLPSVELVVSDPRGIEEESVRVFVDGRERSIAYSSRSGRIIVSPGEEWKPGIHRLEVIARNTRGNYALPFTRYVRIGRLPRSLDVSIQPQLIPTDQRAFAIVRVVSADSVPLPDGAVLNVSVNGRDTTVTCENGKVLFPLPSHSSGKARATVHYGERATRVSITCAATDRYVAGVLVASNGARLRDALVTVAERTFPVLPDGRFAVDETGSTSRPLVFSSPGFFSARRTGFLPGKYDDTISLEPVARGLLQGKTFLIVKSDAPSQASDLLTGNLLSLLRASGARLIVVESADEIDEKRVGMPLDSDKGIIISLQSATRSRDAKVRCVAGPGSRKLQDQVVSAAAHGLPFKVRKARAHLRRLKYRKFPRIEVSIPSPADHLYENNAIEYAANRLSWTIYSGILSFHGYRNRGSKNIVADIVEKISRRPASYTRVWLNGVLPGVTDRDGKVFFPAIPVSEDWIALEHPESFEVATVQTELLR